MQIVIVQIYFKLIANSENLIQPILESTSSSNLISGPTSKISESYQFNCQTSSSSIFTDCLKKPVQKETIKCKEGEIQDKNISECRIKCTNDQEYDIQKKECVEKEINNRRYKQMKLKDAIGNELKNIIDLLRFRMIYQQYSTHNNSIDSQVLSNIYYHYYNKPLNVIKANQMIKEMSISIYSILTGISFQTIANYFSINLPIDKFNVQIKNLMDKNDVLDVKQLNSYLQQEDENILKQLQNQNSDCLNQLDECEHNISNDNIDYQYLINYLGQNYPLSFTIQTRLLFFTFDELHKGYLNQKNFEDLLANLSFSNDKIIEIINIYNNHFRNDENDFVFYKYKNIKLIKEFNLSIKSQHDYQSISSPQDNISEDLLELMLKQVSKQNNSVLISILVTNFKNNISIGWIDHFIKN